MGNSYNPILAITSDSKTIKKISMQIITLLQDYKRGDIIIAIAVLWILACERFGVRPIDTLSTANNMLYRTFDDKHQSQFRALKEYMENEL